MPHFNGGKVDCGNVEPSEVKIGIDNAVNGCDCNWNPDECYLTYGIKCVWEQPVVWIKNSQNIYLNFL